MDFTSYLSQPPLRPSRLLNNLIPILLSIVAAHHGPNDWILKSWFIVTILFNYCKLCLLFKIKPYQVFRDVNIASQTMYLLLFINRDFTFWTGMLYIYNGIYVIYNLWKITYRIMVERRKKAL